MHALGIKRPKTALVAVSKSGHLDMSETVDAQKIVEMNEKGEIKDTIIEGPFAFDVAVSRQATNHKKIKREIASDSDFILMPKVSAGNIWEKKAHLFRKKQRMQVL